MNSRERVLLASSCQRPDRVPIYVGFYQVHARVPRPREWRWRNQVEKAELMLELGADDVLRVSVPSSPRHGVLHTVRRTGESGQVFLVGEYRTPHGTLEQVVRETEDWPHGNTMPLFSDHAVSRARKWWVVDERDLEPLSYMLGPPTDTEVTAFREECRAVQRDADRLGLATEVWALMAGDAAAWLMGFENLMLAIMERPAFVRELLGIIHRWQLARLELLLDSSIDIVVRRAWYESADFWPPAVYHELLAPLVKEEVELVHGAGKLYSYITTDRMMPLVGEFGEIGFDVLWGVDSVQGDADLPRIKAELGGKMSFWGGVNGAITVGHGSRDEIRSAVREACAALAPGGGFVLLPVDQLFEDCPWENVLTLIEAGREFGRYP